jgi:hypothetical protein
MRYSVVIELVRAFDRGLERRRAGDGRLGIRRRFGADDAQASLVGLISRPVLPIEWWRSEGMIVAAVRTCHCPAVILAETESDIGGTRRRALQPRASLAPEGERPSCFHCRPRDSLLEDHEDGTELESGGKAMDSNVGEREEGLGRRRVVEKPGLCRWS